MLTQQNKTQIQIQQAIQQIEGAIAHIQRTYSLVWSLIRELGTP